MMFVAGGLVGSGVVIGSGDLVGSGAIVGLGAVVGGPGGGGIAVVPVLV